MAGGDLILYDEEYRKIQDALSRLTRDSNANSVFMVDRSGQPIASAGEVAHVDSTALASLSAGDVAATEGLARLIGEKQFSSLFHEGEKQHIQMTLVGGKAILVVVFDERSSLGLVRLRVKKATAELAAIFDAVSDKSVAESGQGGAPSPFAEITDADIDNLFAD